MAKKFLRVLYLPGIEGQFKLWRNVFERETAASDEVYQFGNIIGLNDNAKDTSDNRGFNQDLLVAVASRLALTRWTQLVGPNEIAALNMPEEWTNQKSRKILRDMWMGENPLKVAVAVRDRLFSHGGLTYGEWVGLGRPQTANEAARLLNEKYQRTLYQGRCYLLGNPPNYSANPIWAHPSRELYPSWLTAPESLPFDQVTGGGSLNEAEGRLLTDGNESVYEWADSIRHRRYGSKIEINGQRIISVGLELPEEILPALPQDRQLYVERLELDDTTIKKPF